MLRDRVQYGSSEYCCLLHLELVLFAIGSSSRALMFIFILFLFL